MKSYDVKKLFPRCMGQLSKRDDYHVWPAMHASNDRPGTAESAIRVMNEMKQRQCKLKPVRALKPDQISIQGEGIASTFD